VLEKQYGAAGWDQLHQHGLTARRLAGEVADGTLTREGRWLVLDSRWPTVNDTEARWKHELYKALCSCSPRCRAGAVAFRRTAACLWGLDGVEPGAVELAVTTGRPQSGRFFRVRSLAPADCQRLDDLAVTSVSRTLIDLGQVLCCDLIERAVESALRNGYTSVGNLRDAVAALPANQRGTRSLRRLLASRPDGTPPTDSDAETLFLQLARRTGLPEPRRQFVVPTIEGQFRTDFAWPSRRLAVEVDGAATHASSRALTKDLRRQNRLLLSLAPTGWSLLRFTWDDLSSKQYADQVAGKLREAWTIGLGHPGPG